MVNASTKQTDLDKITPGCAWLTVNRSCNFRCKGCYAQGTGYNPNHIMNLELAEELLSLIVKLKIKSITIIGGEPTLWPHLADFNNLCKEFGEKTTIVTNAMQFGIDSFWEKYLESPNTKAGISIKAFDKNSLKEIAEVNSFEISEKGLKRAIAHFKSGVSTVYNTINATNITDIAKFAMDCGARHVSISPCTPAFCDGLPNNTYVVEPRMMANHILDIYPKLVEVTGGRVSFSVKFPICLWPKDFVENLVKEGQISTVCQLQHRTGLIFDVDGNLALCNSLFDYPIGKYGENFNDDESLLELMNSKTVIGFYDKLTSYPSTKCIDCEKYDVCAGGCPLFWSLYQPNKLIHGW